MTQDRNGAAFRMCVRAAPKCQAYHSCSHDYKDLLEKIVCSVNDCKCMLHLCESCSGKLGLELYLSDLFSLLDFDSDDMRTYKQWAHTDRTAIVCITSSVQEFIQTACNSFDSLGQHHYIAKAQ